jgi:hypothetical protein
MRVRNVLSFRAEEQPPHHFERDAREEFYYPTKMMLNHKYEQIEVINISGYGFGGKTKSVVPIGSRITVVLPLIGFVTAEVRWSLCGFFGARFLENITEHYPFIAAACREGGPRH